MKRLNQSQHVLKSELFKFETDIAYSQLSTQEVNHTNTWGKKNWLDNYLIWFNNPLFFFKLSQFEKKLFINKKRIESSSIEFFKLIVRPHSLSPENFSLVFFLPHALLMQFPATISSRVVSRLNQSLAIHAPTKEARVTWENRPCDAGKFTAKLPHRRTIENR